MTSASTQLVMFQIPMLVVATSNNLTTGMFPQFSTDTSGTTAGVEVIHMLISVPMCSHT